MTSTWYQRRTAPHIIDTSPDSGVDYICAVQVSNNSRWEDHARLIAAAPELLEALIECHNELESLKKARDSDYARPDDSTIEQAHAAIKKATE